jgi:heat shock protein HtpX
MMRIALFLGTNIAVMFVLSITMRLLGIDRVLTENGMNYQGLLVMSAVIGFTGSFISLAMSKWMAKRSVNAQVIEQPSNATEIWLVETVRRQSEAAGIGMPEVAIFDSATPNAFATGMNKNNALVAVSTGLLNGMTKEEAEAVMGHEVAHVANGDMVTMTLIQGVVNTFVIFLSRVAGYIVDGFLNKGEQRGPGIGYYLSSMVFELIFGFLASTIVMWFSRQREYRADEGGAKLAGRQNMIAALQRLQSLSNPQALPEQLTAFGFIGGKFGKLFSSHPPLEVRIAALQNAR